MQARRQYALFFVLVGGIVAAGYWVGRRQKAERSVLSAVPADAWFVATIDAAALRASPVGQPLLGGVGGAGGTGGDGSGSSAATIIPGLGPLTEACGFDPIRRLNHIVVCSPEGGEPGEFGVAFDGQFTREELTHCADTIARVRGGAPATVTRGAFVILEDAAHTRFAYRQDGPFLIGRGAWLDAMIDAVEHPAGALRPEHEELRRALASKPGEAERAIVVTAMLPKGIRERLRSELDTELGGRDAEHEGDRERTYASVLAVASAGLALGAKGPGSTTDVALELRCDSAEACAGVKRFIERTRLGFSRNLGLRLVGVGPLLDSLSVSVEGASLTATAHAPTDDVGRAVKRLLDFEAPRRPLPAASASEEPVVAASSPAAGSGGAAGSANGSGTPLAGVKAGPGAPPQPRQPPEATGATLFDSGASKY